MESIQPQLISTTEFAPENRTRTTPFSQQLVVLSKQDHIELKWKANYWKAQYQRLQGRETALKAEVEAHLVTIRDLKQRLYGTQSEKSSSLDQVGESKPASTRKRGSAARQ